MDIAGLSTALSTMELNNQVSMKVLDKSMEQNEDMGKALVQMIDASAMERSVNPSVGANFDMRV